jgi:thiol:disulfide interchange protein DsbA
MFARFAIVALAFALSTAVQAGAIAGHDYVVLPVPQPQESNGKIEVIEFFSWGCPHCYAFSPKMNRWLATLPKDVTFKRVPVGLGHPEWDNLARMYYALQSTGDLGRLDSSVFEAIHKDQVALFDEASITAWVGKHGVNVAQFTAAFHSFGVNASLDQSERMVGAYLVDGVPTLAVAGRYTVSGQHETMVAVANELIVKARGENKKGSK